MQTKLQYRTLYANQMNYKEENVAPVGHLQICATCEYMGAPLEILTIITVEGIC